MGFFLMALQALANHLNQAGVENRRQREILVKAPLPAQRSCWHGLRPQFGKTELLEWNLGQVQDLRAPVVGLAVDAVLVVTSRIALDALLGFQQQHGAGPEHHGSRWTHGSTARLESLGQTMAAQFAFRNSGIESGPLEPGNVVWARDCAVTAANALFRAPTHDAALWILVQSLEGASRSARRIEAVHALPLHKREGRSVLRLVELDHISSEIVQIGWGLVQVVAADVGRSVVRFGTSGDTSLASNADARVVQQSDGSIGDSNVLIGMEYIRSHRDCDRGRNPRLGDAGDELSPGDGHVSPLSFPPASRVWVSASRSVHGRRQFA